MRYEEEMVEVELPFFREHYENHTTYRQFYYTSYKICMIFLAQRKGELDARPSLRQGKTSTAKSKENLIPITGAP